MQNLGFNLIQCTTAKDLWTKLSPENPLAPAPAKLIYRGQGNAKWGLVPSVLRERSVVRSFIPPVILTSEMQIFGEMCALNQFVEHCDSLGLNLPGDSIKLRQSLDTNTSGDRFLKSPSRWPSAELVGLLALAQHHGVPTRLLDWSHRSYVAAYFAASDALKHQKDWDAEQELAVWALNTDTILKMSPDDALPIIGIHPNITLVSAPGSISANLAAQAGLFTLLKERGNRGEKLETQSLEAEFISIPKSPLWKLTLPVTQVVELLRLCEKYWLTAAALFPGYDGAGAATLEAIKIWPRLPA